MADPVALVSGSTIDLHRHVLRPRGRAAHVAPPVPFTLLVMGTAGRGESLLRPDQDNGLIVGDYPDRDHPGSMPGSAPSPTDFSARLDDAGFPLCPGGDHGDEPAMAEAPARNGRHSSPVGRAGVPAVLLSADIAFDFRAVCRGPRTGVALRDHLGRVLGANPDCSRDGDAERR